jgi:hypothetical protein
MSKIDKVAPIRAKLRTDSVAPNSAQSRSDIDDPRRDNPMTANDAPSLDIDRKTMTNLA